MPAWRVTGTTGATQPGEVANPIVKSQWAVSVGYCTMFALFVILLKVNFEMAFAIWSFWLLDNQVIYVSMHRTIKEINSLHSRYDS